MIEPRWLEGAFIVHNDAIDYDDNPAEEAKRKVVDTSIHVSRYRDFAGQNPDKVTYFQPILDTLQYAPSRLELGRDAVFVEGKTDFYMLSYFALNLGFGSKWCFMPGSGASSLGPLISMYLGWAKSFLVLLDDDKAGKAARQKYCDDFLLDSARIATLGDLVPSLSGKRLEDALSAKGKKIVDSTYGRSATKNEIARFFQEKAALGERVEFDEETVNTLKALLTECGARVSMA